MNKKGFTLVELLGVMVLLSVLMMIAIPGISNLVKKNKDKVYVQDAKKLISLAEYKVKSSQNKYIKKPKTNECIILTLGYLNDGTLDTTPNNDEYLKDAAMGYLKHKFPNITEDKLPTEEQIAALGGAGKERANFCLNVVKVYKDTHDLQQQATNI